MKEHLWWVLAVGWLTKRQYKLLTILVSSSRIFFANFPKFSEQVYSRNLRGVARQPQNTEMEIFVCNGPGYACPSQTLHKKMKFSIKYFFSKCDQIRSFLRIWSHLLKKSLMGIFILYSETLRKAPKLYLIYRCGNFVDRHSFCKAPVSGDSSETLGKLCISTKFPYQEIRYNFGILHIEKLYSDI